MVHWTANDTLTELIRRYYRGEAGLWGEIRQHVEEELRRREIAGPHHFRFKSRADGRYEVIVESADGYEAEP